MATIDGMTLEIENFTKNANLSKSIVISKLLSAGILTAQQASEYNDKWQIIVIKNNWFENWMKKFNKKDGWSYKYVKLED